MHSSLNIWSELFLQELPRLDAICRLLLLYFPRNKIEEHYASLNLPPETGKENGENDISERKIRIKALPGVSTKVGNRSSSVSKDGEHQLMKIRSSVDIIFLITFLFFFHAWLLCSFFVHLGLYIMISFYVF